MGFEFESWGSSRRGVRARGARSRSGTLARCGRERGPGLSFRRPPPPHSRVRRYPLFPSRGKVDISPPSVRGCVGMAGLEARARAVSGLHPAGIPPTRPGSRSTSAAFPPVVVWSASGSCWWCRWYDVARWACRVVCVGAPLRVRRAHEAVAQGEATWTCGVGRGDPFGGRRGCSFGWSQKSQAARTSTKTRSLRRCTSSPGGGSRRARSGRA